MRLLFVFILLIPAVHLHAQPREVNLRGQWRVYQHGQYVAFENQQTQSVHLELNAGTHGGVLYIVDRNEFSVFADGQLRWRTADTLKINADSLLKVNGGAVQLSIYQQPRVFSLQTWLVLPGQVQADVNAPRPSAYFSNFVILAVLLLLLFFAALFRTNPQLTFDYLDVIKLFSLQERDEATVTGRIGASLNILFFVFVSFLFALLLLSLFHYSGSRFSLSTYFQTNSTLVVFGYWLLLSIGVFAMLVLKLFLIFIFSQLFGLRDTVRFQFFHFVRLLFITNMAVGLILVIFYVFQVSNAAAFAYLLLVASIVVLLSVGILFIKLLGRTGLPVFHLFSYLCTSEIIPLIILGKVLLF
ncbi:MAG: DUF4271 domain-containing protein [Cyclobacteriaceae bacterium]|nr:DUF4271 domain-containing protein [Cyclobacteriaceae bacterium]